LRRVLLILTVLFMLTGSCLAQESLQTYPAQSGLDAATAVTAMHAAVMRDFIGSDYRFSQLAGADSIFVLFTDDENKNYLMISLTDETDSRADMAVIQGYTLMEFETNCLDSLTAIAMPFIPEANLPAFEEWRDGTGKVIADAYRSGADVELTYYTGEYITCAMSLMHTGGANECLFTAVVSWNAPLTSEDISSLMEVVPDAE